MRAPSFQLYTADFLVGTADMTAQEVGAYIRLLCHQWDKGALPNDFRILSTLAGATKPVVERVLRKFTRGEDGMYRNARMEAVRKEQEEYRNKQSESAKKRWGKQKPADAKLVAVHGSGIGLAPPRHMPNACSPSPSPSPIVPPACETSDPNFPTEDEFATYCEQSLFVPDWFSRDKFFTVKRRGFSPDWHDDAKQVSRWYVNDGRPTNPNRRNGSEPPSAFLPPGATMV